MLLGLFRKKQHSDVADLSHQNLREIPNTLYDVHKRSLQRLNLAKNLLRDFPKGILKFEGLTELDLSDNDILFLPQTLGNFRQLKVLNLSYNNLPNIPDSIQNCEELISVNLTGNPLGRLSDGITLLRQLRHLKLNDCELDALPRNIGRLSKLETLELRDNRLVELPDSFGELQHLEKLDIGTNEFESLSPVIGLLSSLIELWVDNNLLLGFPEEMGMLYNLVFMEASDNRLIDLPSTFGDMCSLKDLYLNDNLLSELPASFGHLHNLQICRLSTNRLTMLPDTLTGLQSLIDFDFSHNYISYLPDSLCSVTSLTSLNANENTLEELPTEIGSCTSLTIISIRNNKVTSMPESMVKLKNLKVLNAIGNRLSSLPFGLLGIESLKAIWLAENQIRPMLEFQTQEDPENGGKWITCVVFPQKEPKNLYEESQTSSTSDLTMIEVHVSDSTQVQPQPVTVNFHSETKENKSSISRDLTPYPKTLKDKVTKWRKAKADNLNPSNENEECDEKENEDTFSDCVQLRHSTPRKLSRPYSLMQALSNPVQDSNGLIHNNASIHIDGVCSSIDLQQSLTVAAVVLSSDDNSDTEEQDTSIPLAAAQEVYPITTDDGTTSDLCGTDVVSSEFDHLDSSTGTNSNSNNNTQDTTPVISYDDHNEQQQQHEPHYQTPSSILSDGNSITASGKLLKYLKLEPDGGIDKAAVQEAPAAWYMSPSPSPYCHDMSSNMNPTDSGEFTTSDLFSPPSHPIASPPAFISPIYGDQHDEPATNDNDTNPPPPPPSLPLQSPITVTTDPHSLYSIPSPSYNRDSSPNSPHYQSPLALTHSVDNSHYDFVRSPVTKQPPNSPSPYRRGASSPLIRLKEKDFAIEYTLQSQMKPVVVHSRDCRSTSSDTDGHHTSDGVEHIYSHPRPVFGSYSGRNTPETPRNGYKSMNSLCDSGIESMRRPTPLGTSLSRSASAGVGLDSPSFGCLSRTYEVTLRKNPTLGMAITGGKDGENALYPNDKGFHVFRLVDGMPASTCGKITVGDKILEVNGVHVSNLTNAQIVKLLTSSEPYTTLLLARQPSMTLL